ncbi:MAG: hypothetical protein P8M30_03800 [Planctomycetaceae bacterium]|jgi:hypothetical protein|nr:hypothetical protein [Planctomycetaceae bacterium]MDG2388427.1 hypothetical protein [Planctomycetaceae bacterium]
MPLTLIIQESFERSILLYRDLVDSLGEESLDSKLPSLPSNTMGSQLWCVVGARESYTNAIRANEWSGFSCSLNSTTKKELVADALRSSADGLSEALQKTENFTDVQNRLMIDLLEHETAHHGQLIRYLYGLGIAIPDSWKTKYALE